MARLKNGTDTGFKDQNNNPILIGDTLKCGDEIIKVTGLVITTKSGKKELKRICYTSRVVHLTKLEKQANHFFKPGAVLTNGNCTAYFKSVSDSGTAANVVCASIRHESIKLEWVVSLKGLRLANKEETEQFNADLAKFGIRLDPTTMQGLKVTPVFEQDSWVKFDDCFGCVHFVVPDGSAVYLKWMFDGTNVTYPKEPVTGCHYMSSQEEKEFLRRLAIAGWSFNSNWDLMRLQHLMTAQVRSEVGSGEISITEVNSLVDSYKKSGIKGEISLRMEF